MTATRQELWEHQMLDQGVNRYFTGIARAKQKRNKDGVYVTIRDEANTSYGVNMLRYFVGTIRDCIKSDIESYKGKPGVTPIAWEYLDKLNLESVAFITAKCIINGISTTTKLTALAVKIATRVEDNCRFEAFEKDDRKYLKSSMRYIKEKKITEYRQKKEILIQSSIKSANIKNWIDWPNKHKVHIGTALLDCFIRATSDYQDGTRIKGTGLVQKYAQKAHGRITYMVCGTSKAQEWIMANHDAVKDMLPDFMPCIEPPMDWISPTVGGFHTPAMQRRKPLVKMQRKSYLHDMEKTIGQMPTFYKAVNALQRTAWEVNTIVYTQMVREFKRNDGIDMPEPEPFVIPPSPLPPFEKGTMTGKEFREFKIAEKKKLDPVTKKAYADWHIVKKRIETQERERVSKAMHIVEP